MYYRVITHIRVISRKKMINCVYECLCSTRNHLTSSYFIHNIILNTFTRVKNNIIFVLLILNKLYISNDFSSRNSIKKWILNIQFKIILLKIMTNIISTS